MHVSLFCAHSIKEVLRVAAKHVFDSKNFTRKGEGNVHAVVVYKDAADFQVKLEKMQSLLQDKQEIFHLQDGIFVTTRRIAAREIAYIFPGQGSQYAGMLRPFLDHAAYKEHASALLAKAEHLSSLLLESGDQATLDQTQNSQPSLAIASWAMAKLLESYGIRPGHGRGS